MRYLLTDAFGSELAPYEVIGTPTDLPGAEALAQEDRYNFQLWALGLVNAGPAQDKKGADGGIDGYIKFFDDNSGKAKKIVVQVKSGGVSRSHVAALKGDMDRKKAVIGALLTLKSPTGPIKIEAAAAGFYEPEYYPGRRYPRLQILTIKELLDGKQLEYPRVAREVTFRVAKRMSRREEPKPGKLF